MGVPAPVGEVTLTEGAILVLMPVIASFSYDISPFVTANTLVPYMLFVSFLLISTLPTLSSKGLNRNFLPRGKHQVGVCLLQILGSSIVGGLFLTVVLLTFWKSMVVFFFMYLGSIPLTYLWFQKKVREEHIVLAANEWKKE
jgi:phosphatidylserine synthase